MSTAPSPTTEDVCSTDRRRQEMAAALSAVVRHVDDGIAIVDDAGRIASINPHLALRAALNGAALIGKPAAELLVWTPEEATTRETRHASLALITDSGRIRCEAMILPIERHGGGLLHIVILHLPDGGIPTTLNDFERRVISALRGSLHNAPARGVSGQIEVVMIDAVRQRLGPRWRQVAEKVMTIAANMIAQRLEPGETFARIADSSFVVAFATTSLDVAALRAQAIAEDILRHLLGDADAEGVSVLGSAEPLPGALPPGAASTDPASVLASRVAAGRSQYETRLASAVAALLRDARLQPRPIIRRGGQPSGLVLAALDNQTQDGLDNLRRAGVFPRTHPESGLLPLALTVDRLYRTLDAPETPPPVHVVPLPLSLLDDRAGFDQFLALARTLPESLRRQLILMITEIGRDTARPRLTDIARRVAPFCRRVGLALDGLDDLAIAYDEIHPTGLRLTWGPALAALAAREPERLQRVIDNAHRQRCLVLIQGVLAPEERALLEDRMAIDLTVD